MAKPITSRDETAKTTRELLDFCYEQGFYVKRNNSLPVPVVRGGIQVGFRPGSIAGEPDVMGYIPKDHQLLNSKGIGGICAYPFGFEVKTGKDKLSEIQIARHEEMRKMGILILVIKTYSDFLEQWEQFWAEFPTKRLDRT